MKNLTSTLTAIALCLATSGLGAQEPVADTMQELVYGSPAWTGTDYATWDTDADGLLSRDEFGTVFEDGVYDDWDADGDGYLDENEWTDANWRMWDTDGDEMVETTEWNAGFDRYDFDEAGVEGIDTWDLDDDSLLDRDEFDVGTAADAWDDWDVDGDGLLASDEAADAVYDVFDEDDDGTVGQDEWDGVLDTDA